MQVSTLLTVEDSSREVELRVVLTSVDMRAVPSKDTEKGEQLHVRGWTSHLDGP